MQLIEAAGRVGRNRQRDSAMIMLGYRHGLRVSELIQLRWDQIDFGQRLMHVTRLKHGNPSVQPLGRAEVDVLTELRRHAGTTRYVFCSERGTPLSSDAFRKIIARAGLEASITFAVHPHMLRHACGYKLAQAGQDTRAIQDYLGHRNIQHTVRYTQLSSERFKDFWQD